MASRKRGFEVLPEFEKQVLALQDELGIEDFRPRRGTSKSAGYDIRSIEHIVIAPGTKEAVSTGMTAYMQDDEELSLRPRSGTAFKKNITIQNAPGTVDADYYDKGGHIKVLVRNEGTEVFVIEPGDRIAQGIFGPYYITDDDHPESEERIGGFGSTGTN